jgi:ATP-binding cassette subfamily B protein
MVRVVREDTQGIRVIKALSKNDYENRRFDKVNAKLSRDEKYAGTIMGIVNPVMTLLMNLGIAFVIGLSATLVAMERSSASTVIAFVQYFTLISMAMMALSRMFVMYTKCSASAKRIQEVIETPDTYFVTEKVENPDTEWHISFENVSFSYFGKRNDLENISFSLKKGESLGIIGATGSGKTTLIRLLLRFYEADSGSIKINGQSITSYTREELTSMLGVALQNDFLYSDTIEENIRFGRSLSHEEIEAAAKIAQAHDFICAKEDGYGHVLAQKGTNLSGGQKQRLLISRAVASKPDILILDDSSSALDYKTDAALRQALRSSMKESTVITVAQRVSSVKDCDLILVLDEGKIIGKGNHEMLLASCPEYKEISDSQMGGAVIE